MENYLYIVLGLIFILAIIDLFVGVSNDAVNFLNSALGSQAAPFVVVLTVASAGVLLGTSFSSGMMEVAKTAVLVPENFTFTEVMIIFTAVIVCDVLLLNTFNSLGLPTSTTVSIVFELLGATTAMACYKIWTSEAPLTDLGLYLNSGKALVMIMGILLSVAIAFVAGFFIQLLVRSVFTFEYEKAYRYLGAVIAAFSVTAIFYFLIVKGASGASFMTQDRINWLNSNATDLLITVFASTFALFELLVLFSRINIFKIVILCGTFALAFAFAGNDLVNFIGVPVAAFESAQIYWSAIGANPDTLTMEALRAGNTTPTVWLVLSGLIMVLTISFSKKAHNVIKTSINLAASSQGEKEQFGSSLPARLMVRGALHLKGLVYQFLPQGLPLIMGKRFEPKAITPGEKKLPFDEIRASVNLVLAAILIASATTLQLPLSTTYVTFMVAMGSSLADGAWNRESAVYRISGVFTVISGWFLTALSAFLISALVCGSFVLLGEEFVILMICFALFIVCKTNFVPAKFKKSKVIDEPNLYKGDLINVRTILSASVTGNLNTTLALYVSALEAFLREDVKTLRKLKGDAAVLYDTIAFKRGVYYKLALEGNENPIDTDARNFYYRAFTSMKEVSYALVDQIEVAENYVDNCHSPFTDKMNDNIWKLSDDCLRLRLQFNEQDCHKTLNLINRLQTDFMEQIATEKLSLRKSELYLGFLLFARDMINHYQMIYLLQSELINRCQEPVCDHKKSQIPNKSPDKV